MNSPDESALEVTTQDQAEAMMALLAVVTVQRDQLQAQQNAKIQIARKDDSQILELNQRLSRYAAALEDWALKNRESFGEKHSIELRQGSLGFRLGNRVVRCLEGVKDSDVLVRLRKLGKKFKDYIRTKEEVDRQRILSDSRPEVAKLSDKDLKSIGLQVVRDEKFWVEPKLETANQSAAAA